jgi:hypothetical protein
MNKGRIHYAVFSIRAPDSMQELSQRLAWPLTLDPSPRAIHVSCVTARAEGRVKGHSNSTLSGSLSL